MRVLSLAKRVGRSSHLWRVGLLVALLMLLVISPAVPSVNAQYDQKDFWVDWDHRHGPQTKTFQPPNGFWYVTPNNIVPDGQIQVGWIVEVHSFTYVGQHAVADFRKSGVGNYYGITPANPGIGRHCFLNYNLNIKQYAGQLPNSAAAKEKCETVLDPGATWRGYSNHFVAPTAVGMGGWYQGGSSGGGTFSFTPIYWGIPDWYAKFWPEPSRGPAPLEVTFTDESYGPVIQWLWDFGDQTTFGTGEAELASPIQHTYGEPGTYTVRLWVMFEDGSEDEYEREIVVEDPVNWVRPFHAGEEGFPSYSVNVADEKLFAGYVFPGYQMIADNPHNAVIGFSQNDKNVVHLATAGKVKAITPLNISNCNMERQECFVMFADTNNAGRLPGAAKLWQFNFLANEVYRVVIELTPSLELHYLVTDPFDFISVGQMVQAGCPIGNSIPVLRQATTAGNIEQWIKRTLIAMFGLFANMDAVNALVEQAELFPVPEHQPMGFTSIILYETNVDPEPQGPGDDMESWAVRAVSVIRRLQDYAEDEPRACDYTPSDCLSPDQEFRKPGAWTTAGQVDWVLGGGVVLYPASSISVQMALSAITPYQVEVWAKSALPGDGNIQVQLGQTSNSFTMGDSQFSQLVVQPATHESDLGLEYTFAIRNMGSVPVLLQSSCVSEEGAGTTGPQACYFEDPSFEGGLASWQASGGAAPGMIPGELVMDNDSTISQMAVLYPNGAATHQYVVTVTATVGFGSEQDLRADLTSKVGFEWEYPAGAGFQPFTAPSSATMYQVGLFFLGYENGISALPDNQIVFQSVVPVSTMQNSAFTIRAKVDSSNPNIKIRLREACINDPFSHHPGDSWTPPPLPVSCFTIPTPQGNDIGIWLFWHWSKLDQFFQCDLMVQLNKIADLSYKTYTLLGWQARYAQSTLMMYTSWLGTDLFPWLDGHFRNMATGSVTIVNTEGGDAGCHDFFCAIVSISDVLRDALGIIGQVLDLVLMAFSLLFEVVSLILRLVGSIFDVILGVINQLFALMQTISLAWNTAEAQEIPFLPSCEVPQENALCVGVWFLENTVFGTTFGRLLIPLLLSFAVTEWLEWMFSQFKNLITAIGEMT